MFEFLKKLKNKNKRRLTRRICFCPIKIKYGNKTYSGFLENVSHTGAQVRISSHENISSFGINKVVSMDIQTPYGSSLSKGLIKRIDDNLLAVTFIDKSDDEKEPLNSLINSEI